MKIRTYAYSGIVIYDDKTKEGVFAGIIDHESKKPQPVVAWNIVRETYTHPHSETLIQVFNRV